jgi:phage shock protein E
VETSAGLTRRQWGILASGMAILIVALIVGWGVATRSPGAPASSSDGPVVQAAGGHWTNVTPAKLTSMLRTKSFTLLNVKTPYIGEIPGTDLYIPYTELTSRSAELPSDKAAKIVVYCRSGSESAIAAQTLVDLGYTNIDNLDGGMNAWTAYGGTVVQVAH